MTNDDKYCSIKNKTGDGSASCAANGTTCTTAKVAARRRTVPCLTIGCEDDSEEVEFQKSL